MQSTTGLIWKPKWFQKLMLKIFIPVSKCSYDCRSIVFAWTENTPTWSINPPLQLAAADLRGQAIVSRSSASPSIDPGCTKSSESSPPPASAAAVDSLVLSLARRHWASSFHTGEPTHLQHPSSLPGPLCRRPANIRHYSRPPTLLDRGLLAGSQRG
jgi:hypothetical protein